MEKEKRIELIAGRIRDEWRKHSTNIEDWPKIAALKLYGQWSEFNEELNSQFTTRIADLEKDNEQWLKIISEQREEVESLTKENKYKSNEIVEFTKALNYHKEQIKVLQSSLDEARERFGKTAELIREGLSDDCVGGCGGELKFCHYRNGEGNKCKHCINLD